MASSPAAPPPPPSSSSSFDASTHARYWLFDTAEELRAVRMTTVNRAAKRVRRRMLPPLESVAESAPTPSTTITSSTTAPPAAAAAAAAPRKGATAAAASALTPLTVDEELVIMQFYVLRLEADMARLDLPTRVRCCAVLFFRRFYLRRSVMDYAPEKIMPACVLLACKAEEVWNKERKIAEAFHKAKDSASSFHDDVIDASMQELLQNEVVVLEGVHFHLHVYHPHRALAAWLAAFAARVALTNEQAKLMRKSCDDLIALAYRSDLIFLYAPPLVAFAVFCLVVRSSSVDPITLCASDLTQDDPARIAELQRAVATLSPLLMQAQESRTSDVVAAAKPLAKRLRALLNPLHDPSSSEYAEAQRRRQAEKEKRREAKRRREQEEYAQKHAKLFGGGMTTVESDGGDRGNGDLGDSERRTAAAVGDGGNGDGGAADGDGDADGEADAESGGFVIKRRKQELSPGTLERIEQRRIANSRAAEAAAAASLQAGSVMDRMLFH